jgi:pimeloyl-ACP methyl ester carboxylesterase
MLRKKNIIQLGIVLVSLLFTITVFIVTPSSAQEGIASITVESVTRDRDPVVGDPPVIQSYNLIKIENAVGTVVLFAGGSGKVGVGDWQLYIGVANFLVQSRFYFAAEGFNVVIIDTPTDFWQLPYGLFGWRTSDEHLSDISAVINDLPNKLGETGPICLIGTSMGTLSAAAYPAENPSDSIDCIVLTSSVTQSIENFPIAQNLLDNVDLESINVPVYLVAHQNDLCYVTPPSDIKVLKSRLSGGSPKVKTKIFDGGTTTLTDECNPLSPHGFFGIEPKVVKDIGKWIRKTIAK